MSMKRLLIISYSIIIIGITCLGSLNILMSQNEKALDEKQEQRYQSYLLADQLRQSSDDLTRMARTYVITGESQYEKMYWDILAIRNGEKPRPQYYDRIYWDLVLTYGDKPRADDEAIPLQELMRRAGFTETEFAKLREAQNNSDGLVKTETIAMNAVKGLYDDGSGHYVKQGEPDFDMARKIMHDTQYHEHKAAIMKPIDEFLRLLDERTKAQVEYHVKKTDFLFVTIQTVVLLLIVLSVIIGIFVTSRILKQVGGEPAKIAQITKQVANGKLDIQFESKDKAVTGIYAAVQVMVNNLAAVIEDIVQVSQGVAKGNLRIMPQAEYKGDFVQIKHALEIGVSNVQSVVEDIVQVSQGLAAGNLHVMPKAEYGGDFVQIKNALEMALSDLVQVIEDIVQVSQALVEGKQHITGKAEYRGDFLQVKNALETAATKLAEATAKNATQDWLKTGQAQLNNQISGEQEIISLAKNVISFLTTYVNASVGVFYLLKEPDLENQKPYLQIIASYAYTATDNRPTQFFVGEGLVGQVALEQKTIALSQTPEECPPIIRSSLADARPRHILLLPFGYENAIKGVIEIGSTSLLTDIQRELLEQIMPSIGIAVNTAESRTKMQILLQQSQTQAKELQNQKEALQGKQAELQKTNDELQAQSEELQTQAAELQAQQEELRQTNEELEVRTRDLEHQREAIRQKNVALETTQAEMEKARVAIETKAKELELASRYKSEFLANMSHELRTPLNSILILAQLLTTNKTGNLDESQVEYAKTIHSAGSDLLTLINEILDLSKIEAGKIEAHFEEVSLTELTETLEKKFCILAQNKDLDFQITVADDMPFVLHTDKQRLQQIINNLLSNAFKFTEKGGIKLLVQRLLDKSPIASLFQKETEGDFFAISVTDTGIGISEDKQQVIFEAFQQADGSTSRRYGGTGLGLSISRQLARLLGGELVLTSKEGKGSTFTLYLPETLPKASSLPSVEIKSPVDSVSANVLTPKVSNVEPLEGNHNIVDDRNDLQPDDKSILIIEDDRQFASILMKLAREKDFKCIVANDGKTGLQLVAEYQPHAIILDVGLPQLDGLSVMDKIKDDPNTRHIPVHFMSASDQIQCAKKMGAIGYSLKPVNMGELSNAFNKIEQFIAKTIKNVLLVTDNKQYQQQIINLVENGDVQITSFITMADALQHIKTTSCHCIILDVDVEQGAGIKFCEQLRKEDNLSQIPVILYTERDLSAQEEQLLQCCSDSLTVKAVKSPERLLDEATLFLHQIESKLSDDKRQMLKMVHDKKAILEYKKVLLVDDDIRNAYALTTFLEEQGMEVNLGSNGKEALKQLEEHPDTAIVLMDIMMPEMDGYETMRKIRQQPHFRQLPIIALTAKAMKGDKAKCIEAGANDYLSKPVDTDKLISLMRVWLYQ